MTDGYTGADLFADALERYTVEHVFGNPGTSPRTASDRLALFEFAPAHFPHFYILEQQFSGGRNRVFVQR